MVTVIFAFHFPLRSKGADEGVGSGFLDVVDGFVELLDGLTELLDGITELLEIFTEDDEKLVDDAMLVVLDLYVIKDDSGSSFEPSSSSRLNGALVQAGAPGLVVTVLANVVVFVVV